MTRVQQASEAVLAEVEKVIFGKRAELELVLACLLAKGHLLLEDVPGTAKTLLAKSLAKAIGGRFNRLQCTPDLLPTDVTGSSVFNQKTAEFDFVPGPVLTHILLADEINRATPRAQAALLECMAEGQVSVDNRTLELPAPFFVVATQNPLDFEGTFALPEAQLDRFLMRLSLGYPSRAAELQMLASAHEDPDEQVATVLSLDVLKVVQAEVQEVFVHHDLRDYILSLVTSTRSSEDFALGAGPRATLALFRAAQALAAMNGRDFATPDDVKRLAPSVLTHRIVASLESRLSERSMSEAVQRALGRVPVPTIQPRTTPPETP